MYLVAHVTRKPPRPAKVFREENNKTDSSITQVTQEETDQVILFLPTCHNLSANIRRIVNRRHMVTNLLSDDRRLTYCMVENRV
jgi:hypothetical protein